MNYIKKANELFGVSVPIIQQPSFIAQVIYYMTRGYSLKEALRRALKDQLLIH